MAVRLQVLGLMGVSVGLAGVLRMLVLVLLAARRAGVVHMRVRVPMDVRVAVLVHVFVHVDRVRARRSCRHAGARGDGCAVRMRMAVAMLVVGVPIRVPPFRYSVP